MSLIEFRDVWKVYGIETPYAALRGVSITVEAGTHCSIVGRSGSGKSTLLGLMACLDRPSKGQVMIAGEDVGDFSDDARSRIRRDTMGFVFQQFHLVEHLSAQENVGAALLFRGLAPARRKQLACQMLERVGLADRISNRPSQLSGGEQQRVAIARALVSDPELVLADEPTGSLDAANGLAVLSLLESFLTPARALVVVTHDPAIAMRATTVVEIADGRVMSAGSLTR